jgi:Tol biopolymer transport system component
MGFVRQIVILVVTVATSVGFAMGAVPSGQAMRTVGTIAFVDNGVDGWSVFAVRSDGTHRRLLIDVAASPSWSPDGRKIAAVEQIISIYSAGGKYLGDLRFGGVCDEAAWSPNGRQIACVGPTDDRLSNVSRRPGLFLEDAKTGSEKQLADNVDWNPSPTWSPDSTQLAFTDSTGQIRVLDLKTGNLRTLGPGRSPDWSPRGNAIAYSTGTSIVVSRTDGTGRQEIVRSKGTIVDQPSWSPDGGRLVYAVFAKGWRSRGLRLVSASGGRVQVLTKTGSDPDWKPR